MALLKRFDVLVAAALFGWAVAPVASNWLCAEASCRSSADTVRFYSVWSLATVVTLAVVWRVRRWPARVLLVLVATYATYVVPGFLYRYGRWTLQLESRSCVVRAGDEEYEVRRACGRPDYVCRGPKFVESGLWNPLSIVVCGFSGDVYANPVVTYSCAHGVAAVTGFDKGPHGDWRPPHCIDRVEAAAPR